MATNEKFILEFATQGVEKIDSAKSKIESLNSKINTLATAILGVSFASFISGALQAADRVSDFSDATGITISSLKAFGAALDESGGKAKNTEKIINGFYAAIDSANQGSLAARDAFKAVGVSLSDLQNLDESKLLEKTLAGLRDMPAGSERAAIATTLLTRAFRGIDPKAFWDALDPEKFKATEEATKKAAEAQQKLEEKYRTLQEGAIKALEPILKLMGEHTLTVAAAEKIVTALGVAMGLAFGASVLANIVKINAALGITAGLSNLIGKGPVGLIAKLAALGGTAALSGDQLEELIKKNDALTASADKTAQAVEESRKKFAATDPRRIDQGGKVLSTSNNADAAKRRQELDARQKAELESSKRIAQSIADTEKYIAEQTASDIEKIALGRDADIAKALEDIKTKEYLSEAQKAKEFAQKKKEIEAKANLEIVEAKRQQEAQLVQQKAQYSQQNVQLLGREYTEVQRITDQIAQQPLKYKEIGDEMLKNARIQDDEKRRIEEIIRLRAVDKSNSEILFKIMSSGVDAENKIAIARLKAAGASDEMIAKKQAEADATQKIYELSSLIPGAYEAGMIAAGRENELTKQQIADAKTYNDLFQSRVQSINDELATKRLLAEEDARLAKDFDTGWSYALNKYVENSQKAAEEAKTYFDTFARGFEDAMVRFVQTGKLSFKDLANTIIAEFVKIQSRKLLSGIFDIAGGGGGGLGFLGSIGKLLGFADGGSPPVGVPSIVGERGPELFIPRTAGTIVPNELLGQGSTTQVTYNINAVDASSFQQLLARDPQFLFAVSEKGRRSMPQGAMR
jgi:hypothetical protein